MLIFIAHPVAYLFDFTFCWRKETPFNEPCLVLHDMLIDHGLVGINQHIYLFYDFNYPKQYLGQTILILTDKTWRNNT